jgi:predicted Zn-dependent protease
VPEVSVASLDARQRKLAENAHAALARGQLAYVLGVTAQILKTAPGCLAIRRLQRSAQLRRGRPGLVGKVVAAAAVFLWRAGSSDPGKALVRAEQLLARAPTSIPALQLLADAAARLDLPETAAFALAAIRELAPEDHANLLALGDAWLAAGRPAEALRVAEHVLAAKPVDAGALDLLRKASVAQTVEQGNWESPESFRGKLKDEALRPATARAPDRTV